MENIDSIKALLVTLDTSVDQLDESLESITKKSLDDIAESKSNTIERIRTYNNYSYVLMSLIFSYLKTIGVSTDEHPILRELARVKSNMKRLKDLEQNKTKEESSKEQSSEQAKEFLRNALGKTANGGGAAYRSNMSEPAVSSSSFKGVHTKFEDEDNNLTPATLQAKKSKNRVKKSNKLTKRKG